MPKVSKSVSIINVLKALKAVDRGNTEDLSYYMTRKFEEEGLIERTDIPRTEGRGRGRNKKALHLSKSGKHVLDFAKSL